MITNEELNKSLKAMGKEDFDGREAKTVELEDTIKFNCKRCGKCCTGRSDIILNPFDIYQIAKGLNMTTDEVIKNYCIVYCGSGSCLPIVVLKEDERGLCPFLKFFTDQGKFGCSINTFKPGACMMHPIGIVRSFEKGNSDKLEKQFIEVPSCNIHGTDIEIKVKDFIKPYLDNEECHETGSLLQFEPNKYVNVRKLINGLMKKDEDIIKENFSENETKLIERVPEVLKEMIYRTYMTTTLESMHSFDVNKGFLEQLDDVKATIRDNSLKMLVTVNCLGFDFSSDELTEEDKEIYASIEDDLKNEYNKFVEEHLNESELDEKIKKKLSKMKELEE